MINSNSPIPALNLGYTSQLQICSIIANEEYLKEWNETMRDFVVMTKYGELISNSLYRIGGMSKPNVGIDDYFMLLKYVEAHYSQEWLDSIGSKSGTKHLEGRWCIIDKDGIEKVVFDHFKSPYLVKGSCIYSLDSNYYNIETGKKYCCAGITMQSHEYLFLNNELDEDRSKRGIMKIHKKTGEFELFPSSK